MNEPAGPYRINVNTGVSIGLAVMVACGVWAILSAIGGTKTEVGNTRSELNGRFDKMEMRVANLESTRNTWTGTDMFKWAVHLQQANSDPKKLQLEGLKVPEPEVNTK